MQTAIRNHPDTQSTIDNRRDERYVFCQKGQLIVAEQRHPIRTLDVSINGFGIRSEVPVNNNQRCVIVFSTLIGDQITPMQFSCMTTYCILNGLAGYRIGLCITETGSANRLTLHALVERCSALLKLN